MSMVTIVAKRVVKGWFILRVVSVKGYCKEEKGVRDVYKMERVEWMSWEKQ